MSGDYDQTDQVSHGCFLRHCSKEQQLPWARISGVNPFAINVGNSSIYDTASWFISKEKYMIYI